MSKNPYRTKYEIGSHVRDGELRCTGCWEWKLDEAFHQHAGNKNRRQRQHRCKTCYKNYRKIPTFEQMWERQLKRDVAKSVDNSM